MCFLCSYSCRCLMLVLLIEWMSCFLARQTHNKCIIFIYVPNVFPFLVRIAFVFRSDPFFLKKWMHKGKISKWNDTCHEYVNRLKWHELLLLCLILSARWIYWNTLTVYGRMFRSWTHWFLSFPFVYILKIEWIRFVCARCVNDFVKKTKIIFNFAQLCLEWDTPFWLCSGCSFALDMCCDRDISTSSPKEFWNGNSHRRAKRQ